MAGITLAQADAHLQLWLECDAALSKRKSYTMGAGTSTARMFTSEDAKEVRSEIAYWQRWVEDLSPQAGRGRFYQVVPR